MLGVHVRGVQTLTMTSNSLESLEDVSELAGMPCLSCLDLKDNELEDPAVIDVFESMPALRVLYLQGNPVVKTIRHYRKTVLSRLPGLRFLDDRPVFDEERERVTAWAEGMAAGGAKAAAANERATIAAQKQRQREADERNFRAFEAMIRHPTAPGEDEARSEAFLGAAEAATAVARRVAAAALPAGAEPVEPEPMTAEQLRRAAAAAEAAGAEVRRGAGGVASVAASAADVAAASASSAPGRGGETESKASEGAEDDDVGGPEAGRWRAVSPTSEPVPRAAAAAATAAVSASVPASRPVTPPASTGAGAATRAGTGRPKADPFNRAGADREAEAVLEPCRSGSEAAVRAYRQAPAGIGRQVFRDAVGTAADSTAASTVDTDIGVEAAVSKTRLPAAAVGAGAGAGKRAPAASTANPADLTGLGGDEAPAGHVERSLPERPGLRTHREARLAGPLLGGTARLDPAGDARRWDAQAPEAAASVALPHEGAAALLPAGALSADVEDMD